LGYTFALFAFALKRKSVGICEHVARNKKAKMRTSIIGSFKRFFGFSSEEKSEHKQVELHDNLLHGEHGQVDIHEENDDKPFAQACCPCCYPAHEYFDYFWFKSPDFFIRAFQMSMFFEAVYITLFVLVFSHLDLFRWWWFFVYAAPPFHFLFFYGPSAIPHFVLISSVGPLTRTKVIKYVEREHDHRKKEKNKKTYIEQILFCCRR